MMNKQINSHAIQRHSCGIISILINCKERWPDVHCTMPGPTPHILIRINDDVLYIALKHSSYQRYVQIEKDQVSVILIPDEMMLEFENVEEY